MAFDTMVADYLLEAGERNHNLDDLAKRYLDHTTIKIDQLIGKGKNQKRMDEVPVADVSSGAGKSTAQREHAPSSLPTPHGMRRSSWVS